MKLKLTVIAALAASMIYGQEHAAAKPEPKGAAVVAPTLSTAKLWRLLSKAQTLRQQLNDSPAGKETIAAEAAVQVEQKKLSDECVAIGKVLGFDQDEKSKSYQDLTCATAPPPPPTETKGK